MAEVTLCLDTYALWEISQENPKFTNYLNREFVITDITLAEFYGVILREFNIETADYWFKKLEHYSVSVDKSILIKAIRFRYKYRKKKISFFDAVGYIFSLEKGYIFTTGDKEFEKFKSVEFRKK